MKLCRFADSEGLVHAGLVLDDRHVRDLSAAGIASLAGLLEREDIHQLAAEDLPKFDLSSVRLLAPVEQQEVWAVGVTYLRSKKARMEESDFSASAYDRVYEASRPELFFKSMPEKVVGPGESVGIRKDAKWNVPEPELAFVINSRGQIAGYTIGNDMSSRDIEGENLLYLPQAKIYNRSCALGPFVTVGVDEATAREWTINLRIVRNGKNAFDGQTRVANIKRPFAQLVEYLFRSQTFSEGVVLLTGTGIVPPDTFTLTPDDVIQISIDGIGTLENKVAVV